MGKVLSFREAAVAMEKKMAGLYQRLGRWARSDRTRELLEFLASEEDGHVLEIEKLTDVPVQAEALDKAFGDAGEIMSYLQMDATETVRTARGFENEEDILKLGIQGEKDALVFYQQLLKYVEGDALRGQVEKLVDYEFEHMNRLYVLLKLIVEEQKKHTPGIDEMRK
jgi:rubrerythrin